MEVEIPNVEIKFYAIRNKDGKWFRAKGYGGGGNSWVDDIKKAKVYGKIGPARSCVTWWSNNYPRFGVPELIEIICTKAVVLDEESRVKKAQEKKAIKEANYEKRKRKYELDQAMKNMVDAQARVIKMKNQIKNDNNS